MMKRPTGQDEDDMDRILSRDDEILPSSGFAASVMDAVRREAAAPPPIPFPWKRALPGVVVGVFTLVSVLVAGIVLVSRAGTVTVPQTSLSSPLAMSSLLHGGMESAAIWTVMSLMVAFVAVKLSTGLVSGR